MKKVEYGVERERLSVRLVGAKFKITVANYTRITKKKKQLS